MLEGIGIGIGKGIDLLSRIADKALDKFWRDASARKHPIIDLQGNLSYSLSNEDGLLYVRNDFTASPYDEFEFIFGSLFLPDPVQELLSEDGDNDKVLLLMVYGEDTQDLLLSELDVSTDYMLDLPHGVYSFFGLILDAGTEDLLDSTIYAIGLPCEDNLNNPDLESFYLENPAEIMEFVNPSPVEITGGGPYYLNLIMLDTEQIPDCPLLLSEFLEEDFVQSPI
ncbi:hypothetical protein ACSAZK_14350 [Methanosarcina sp. Mfa9]|uniref:hypothetical protein n=1 Tax=Methanosarcina sp. Mfa9 TaxID=3439063 RepID=UPI003F839783